MANISETLHNRNAWKALRLHPTRDLIGRRVEPPPSLFGGRLSISIPHHFFAQCEQTRHVAILFRRSWAAIISLRPWSLEIKVCHFRPRARWLGGGLPVNVAGPCVVVPVRREYPGRCRIVGIARTAFRLHFLQASDCRFRPPLLSL